MWAHAHRGGCCPDTEPPCQPRPGPGRPRGVGVGAACAMGGTGQERNPGEFSAAQVRGAGAPNGTAAWNSPWRGSGRWQRAAWPQPLTTPAPGNGPEKAGCPGLSRRLGQGPGRWGHRGGVCGKEDWPGHGRRPRPRRPSQLHCPAHQQGGSRGCPPSVAARRSPGPSPRSRSCRRGVRARPSRQPPSGTGHFHPLPAGSGSQCQPRPHAGLFCFLAPPPLRAADAPAVFSP